MRLATLPLACTGPVRVPVDFAEPYRNRLDGGTDGEGQRFPFTVPIPGSPANKTLDFSVYEPLSYFPGYDIHNRLPYAEHFNFSIQRELSKSTVLTLSYVGTEGHRLIAQTEANPGDAALCNQLNAQGYTDASSGAPGVGRILSRTPSLSAQIRFTAPGILF